MPNIEIVQVAIWLIITLPILAVFFIVGYSKGFSEGYKKGLRFGYIAVKDREKLLDSNDCKAKENESDANE